MTGMRPCSLLNRLAHARIAAHFGLPGSFHECDMKASTAPRRILLVFSWSLFTSSFCSKSISFKHVKSMPRKLFLATERVFETPYLPINAAIPAASRASVCSVIRFTHECMRPRFFRDRKKVPKRMQNTANTGNACRFHARSSDGPAKAISVEKMSIPNPLYTKPMRMMKITRW